MAAWKDSAGWRAGRHAQEGLQRSPAVQILEEIRHRPPPNHAASAAHLRRVLQVMLVRRNLVHQALGAHCGQHARERGQEGRGQGEAMTAGAALAAEPREQACPGGQRMPPALALSSSAPPTPHQQQAWCCRGRQSGRGGTRGSGRVAERVRVARRAGSRCICSAVIGGGSGWARQWCRRWRMWEAMRALLVASSTDCSAWMSSAGRRGGEGGEQALPRVRYETSRHGQGSGTASHATQTPWHRAPTRSQTSPGSGPVPRRRTRRRTQAQRKGTQVQAQPSRPPPAGQQGSRPARPGVRAHPGPGGTPGCAPPGPTVAARCSRGCPGHGWPASPRTAWPGPAPGGGAG